MKDLAHDPVELFNSAHRQSADLGMGMQTGSEENLIRVDISDTGDDLLVHQEGFEPASPLPKDSYKILLGR